MVGGRARGDGGGGAADTVAGEDAEQTNARAHHEESTRARGGVVVGGIGARPAAAVRLFGDQSREGWRSAAEVSRRDGLGVREELEEHPERRARALVARRDRVRRLVDPRAGAGFPLALRWGLGRPAGSGRAVVRRGRGGREKRVERVRQRVERHGTEASPGGDRVVRI